MYKATEDAARSFGAHREPDPLGKRIIGGAIGAHRDPLSSGDPHVTLAHPLFTGRDDAACVTSYRPLLFLFRLKFA